MHTNDISGSRPMCAALVSLLAFCAISDSAFAQRGSVAMAQKETLCRALEPGLMQFSRADSLENVLWQVIECPEAGGDPIAKRWVRAPEDSAMLERLVKFSVQVWDGRIFDSVMQIASDRSRSRLVRASAIRVLWYYALPGGIPILGSINSAGSMTVGGVPVASAPTIGVRSVPLDARARVESWAKQIAATASEEPYVVAVSKSLLSDLLMR